MPQGDSRPGPVAAWAAGLGLAAVAVFWVPSSVGAQVAGADSVRYEVSNHGRPAGEMIVLGRGDSLEVRYGHVDRNRGRWLYGRYGLVDGDVVSGEGGPMTREWVTEPAEERFDAGSDVPFLRRFATPFEIARSALAALSAPDGTLTFADEEGESTVRARVVAERTVALDDGTAHDVRLVMVQRGGGVPNGVWLDERGDLFATEVGWFITAPEGAASALAVLREAEIEYRERQAEALARRLAPEPSDALVVRGGDVFDSEGGTLLPDHTVVVEGGRITAVGPTSEVAVPTGARIIEAGGRTVLPGLWDMHSHSGLTSQNGGAPLQLANGLTTVRDLAADLDVAVALRERAASGDILSPRQVLAGFIEGPGAWAGPTEALARDEAEARRWVARYDSLGYRQIKLYNLVHPDLVPTIAAEARARGLRLSGHVPRGMSVEAAVALGYDEINHAAFLFSTFFPDSLYLPNMRPYSGVAAAVAPSFDVDGEPMDSLLAFLARSETVVDGTFNLWMGGRSLLDGNGDPGAEAYLRLIARLYQEGVTLVPGTDNSSGSTFLTELELYELAGIPAPEVLRLATLVSARVMNDDTDYGSLAPGKVADILVVDGRPSERIADLEHIEWVIRAGRVYDPDEIRRAVRDENEF